MKVVALLMTTVVSLSAFQAVAQTPIAASREEAGGLSSSQERALYLGVIENLRKEGKVHAALAHLDAYELKNPRDPKAQILRADCLTEIGDLTGAEALYLKLTRGALADQAEFGLGHVQARRADWTAAAAAFGRAVKIKPTESRYLNDLGFALTEAGRANEAAFRLRQAAELSPGDELIRNNLIVALKAAGQDEAAAEIVRGLTSDDDRREAEGLLASADLRMLAGAAK